MGQFRRLSRLLILALLLGACLWIAWRVPYAHDDWDWGLPQGLRWWLSGEMNNRYCGSFFVIMMTRSQVIKTLVMGITMFALPVMAARIAADRYPEHRFPLAVLGCAALMAMPLGSWRQTYGWVSAFANFVVAGVWILALIALIQLDLKRNGRGKAIPIAVFPLALTAQLFVENVTVVLTAAALVFAVWAWRTGRNRPVAFSVFGGAIIGLVLMLYNPLYSDLLSTGTAVNGVRRLIFPLDAGLAKIVAAVLERFFCLILPDLFECYPVLWALVCAGGMWRALRAGRPWPVVMIAGLFSSAVLLACYCAMYNTSQGLESPQLLTVVCVAGPVMVCILLLLVLISDPDRHIRLYGLGLLAAVIALAAPFAVLWERGPRCCFPSAVLLLLMGLLLLHDFPWNISFTTVAVLLLGVTVVFHMKVYQVIGACSALREQLLQEAVEQGSSSVILPTEDWDYFYFWVRNPSSEPRAASFRAFYGLPEDLELLFLQPGTFDVWPDITPEMIYYGTVR